MSGVPELKIIDPSGGSSDSPATPRQQQLCAAVCAVIEADERFRALHQPALSRAEINAGLPETGPGYLYLRYDVPGAVPQEFWGHVGKTQKLAWKSGQVCVPLPADAPTIGT